MVTYALNTRCRNCIWIQTTRGIGACIKWSVAHTFIMSSLLATIVHSAGSILTTYLFDTSSWFSSCCFCCFDFRCSCFHLVPKTLTAQWNQPPWCWSVLRFISFRLGTGNGFTIDLKVKLVTVVLCWVYVIIQRKNMSSIFCPKQAVFSYWDFWTSNFVEALAHGHFYIIL